MVKMKIGIIGRGTVGDAVYHGLAQVDNVMSHYDIKDGSCISDISSTEIVFVCVPTDTTPDGRCDVSIVDDVVHKLYIIKYPGIISIKSTVIPGTTDRLIKQFPDLNLCCVPEFLRQKSAHSDFFDNHNVLVVGTHDLAIADKITRAHRLIPKSVTIMSPVEAEVVKYFNNVHNAMEIVFANIMYEICTKVGADYQEVLSTIAKRDNINTAYLKCSNFYKGYQGHCLPKDTMAWEVLAKDLAIDVLLFHSIVEDNRRYTK